MAITTYAGLLPYLVDKLPGCGTNIITKALLQKTRDFCIETEGLFDLNTKVALVADQKLYTLAPSQVYYEIIRVSEARVNTSEGIAAGEYGVTVTPLNYAFRRPTTLEFFNAPAAYALANGLETDLVVSPLQDATSMDFNFITAWARQICAGVLADLKAEKDRPWSDPAGVQSQLDEWSRGVAFCRRESYVHRGPSTLKMRPPSWV